jgi:hypothetical protein
MALFLLFCFSQIKKPLPGLVTVFVQSNFKNRPSPSPYAGGNNNPDNYRDPYEADVGADVFHDTALPKNSGLSITIRFHLVKRIFYRIRLSAA